MPMIAMTTSNSTNVKPRGTCFLDIDPILIWQVCVRCRQCCNGLCPSRRADGRQVRSAGGQLGLWRRRILQHYTVSRKALWTGRQDNSWPFTAIVYQAAWFRLKPRAVIPPDVDVANRIDAVTGRVLISPPSRDLPTEHSRHPVSTCRTPGSFGDFQEAHQYAINQLLPMSRRHASAVRRNPTSRTRLRTVTNIPARIPTPPTRIARRFWPHLPAGESSLSSQTVHRAASF